jgi:hypothetical protein
LKKGERFRNGPTLIPGASWALQKRPKRIRLRGGSILSLERPEIVRFIYNERMNMDQDNALPYGARGMDFENFSWEVRPDGKVHFFAKKDSGPHWTLHPGSRSGVLDLHETSVNVNGTRSHKTLFMIKVEDVDKLVNEIGLGLIPGLFQQFRPLNLRWVRRRKIAIVRDPSSTPAELAAVTYENRRKRLQFDPQKIQQALEDAISPDDLLVMPDGSFRLMAIRRWGTRWVGVGLKVTDWTGATYLLWARPEELVDFGERAEGVIRETAMKYLIPAEDYPKCLSL